MNKRQRIVYITGLGGSGTTMLGILLARMSNTASLGEISRAFRVPAEDMRHPKNRCTCGDLMADCAFWGELDLPGDESASKERLYSRLLRTFRQHYPDRVLVDNSKYATDLRAGWLAASLKDQVEVYAIHIIRDFRGWALTQERKHSRHGGMRRYKPLLMHCLAWWWRNRSRARALKQLGIPVLTLSYESLVFDNEREMQRIASFAGLNPGVADQQAPVMHDCSGNNVRLDPECNARLRYDFRWLLDGRFLSIAPLLIPVHRYWKSVNRADTPVAKLGFSQYIQTAHPEAAIPAEGPARLD